MLKFSFWKDKKKKKSPASFRGSIFIYILFCNLSRRQPGDVKAAALRASSLIPQKPYDLFERHAAIKLVYVCTYYTYRVNGKNYDEQRGYFHFMEFGCNSMYPPM